jgi:hypothetical protein
MNVKIDLKLWYTKSFHETLNFKPYQQTTKEIEITFWFNLHYQTKSTIY